MKIKSAKKIHKLIIQQLVEENIIHDDSCFGEVIVRLTPADLNINVDYEEASLDVRNL
jgi:cystathionine beta-lyase family protein involved in aluminum resistance